MYSKIAIKNFKRSYKDYTIYFLTLTLGVCIFYSFNSIESQSAMLKLSRDVNYMLTLNILMAVTSFFVSLVLGGLMLYANQFLMRKRKKEIGIYMTLGMAKRRISKILTLETVLIGVLSLVVGILLGFIVSQGISLIAASLLSADLSKYKFVISLSAIMKSVVYFGIIFLIVMIFNQYTISKYKLIDMLNAAKKNEKIKLKQPFVSILIFMLSILLLVIAYTTVLNSGLSAISSNLIFTIVSGVIGTLLFFFSLSNFFIQVVQKNKNVYLKGINIFILRQIHNKINTNYLSMTVICLMLFLTITILFTTFDLKGRLDKNVAAYSFDAAAFLVADNKSEDPAVNNIEQFINDIDFSFEPHEKHTYYSEYKLNVTMDNVLSKYLSAEEITELHDHYLDGTVSAIKISDYNSIISLNGKQAISLEDNEVLVVSNFNLVKDAMTQIMENGSIITIEDRTYTVKNRAPIEENIKINSGEFFYLIIPDNYNGSLQLEFTAFNVKYDEGYYSQSEERFSDLFHSISEDQYGNVSSALVIGSTKEQKQARDNASVTLIVFLGLFICLIFIISSSAVMALQQLSDASDSLERYISLKKIGVTEKLINQAVLRQNLIYFMIPLLLAVVHSVIAVCAFRDIYIFQYESILVTALLLTVIYGGYFYATYVGVKNIIKAGNKYM